MTDDGEKYLFCVECKKYWYPSKGHVCTTESGLEDSATMRNRIIGAVALAGEFGGTDGEHHKTWVIDQMCRILLGDEAYASWVKCLRAGEDGPDTYEWDEGIAP
jgi:hypothetical protein